MTTLQALALYAVLPVLAISTLLALVRLVRGPSSADRVVALDLITTTGLAIVATYALINKNPAFLDVAVVIGLIGFLGTVAFARYIERRV